VRVAVFAGSAMGVDPVYARETAAFARQLAASGVGVVYGGGRVGLMGVLADAAIEAGGEVIGVIPRRLVAAEIAHPGLSELRIVETMHERKAVMAELADAFVALPGGAGTLEELFEAWTWQQLGLHAKPVALLEVAGVWSRFLASLDHLVAAGFLRPRDRESLLVCRDAADLLAAVRGWQAPPSKWGAPGATQRTADQRAADQRAAEQGASGSEHGGPAVKPSMTSVGWLRVRGGRLLVVRTAGRDAFYLPGGKPEPGESGPQALSRELSEELGLELRSDTVAEAFTVEDDAHGRDNLLLRMTCYTGQADGDPAPGREIEEVAWVGLEDGDRCAPAVRQVLRILQRQGRLGPRGNRGDTATDGRSAMSIPADIAEDS
jgi:uncharacterized protein (TIGR00730 family)